MVALGDAPPDRRPHAARTACLCMSLLGEFRFTRAGCELPLAEGPKRLLALLAVRDRSLTRAAIAGILWGESSELQAQGNLRSTLFRMHEGARRAVELQPGGLRLAEDVTVDLRDARALARRLLDGEAQATGDHPGLDAVASLSSDLLPGWYDDWVLLEAETWRQLRLHALEALARSLVSERRHGEAAIAAAAAVSADPLRESARAALVAVHLAEGNQSEALREVERYTALLRAELDLEPTPALRSIVAHIAKSVTPA